MAMTPFWITDDLSGTYYPWTLDPNNPVKNTSDTTGNIEQVLWSNVVAGTNFTVHIG